MSEQSITISQLSLIPNEVWEYIMTFVKMNRDKIWLYKATCNLVSWSTKTRNSLSNIVVWFDPVFSEVFNKEKTNEEIENYYSEICYSYEENYFNDERNKFNYDIYWTLKIDLFPFRNFNELDNVSLAFRQSVDKDDSFVVTKEMIDIFKWYYNSVLDICKTPQFSFTIDDILTRCLER
jgi:hypothetical protein